VEVLHLLLSWLERVNLIGSSPGTDTTVLGSMYDSAIGDLLVTSRAPARVGA